MKKAMLLFIFTILILGGWFAFSCTGFTASSGNLVLIGNTEDYAIEFNDPVIRIRPASLGKYGCVLVGFGRQDFSMGGVNDQGLFYDWFSVPKCDLWHSFPDKPGYPGFKPEHMLEVCANVEEAIAFFQNYNFPIFRENHVFVVDKTGASAIIEWGEDNLEVIRKEGNYQVITNFFILHPQRGYYPCSRYSTATRMLENSTEISFDLFHSILESVYRVYANAATQYSNIYEIRGEEINMFMFNYHNHDEFIKLNIRDELEKGWNNYELPGYLSEIKLSDPADMAVVSPSLVRFGWRGKIDSIYRLYYSTDPDFTGCVPIEVTAAYAAGMSVTGIAFFMFGILSFGILYKKRGESFKLIAACLLIVIFFMTYCGHPDDNTIQGNEPGFNVPVENLQPNATYYWKVTANTTDIFTSESIVRTFTTNG